MKGELQHRPARAGHERSVVAPSIGIRHRFRMRVVPAGAGTCDCAAGFHRWVRGGPLLQPRLRRVTLVRVTGR